MSIKDPVFSNSFHFQMAKGDRRRLQIVDAAVTCIAKFGLEGAIFDRVAESLDIQRSHVAYYFKTREDLLYYSVQYVIAEAQRITLECVESTLDPLERILGIAKGAFTWAQVNPDQARLLLLFYFYSYKEKRLKHLQNQIRSEGLRRIQALLASMPSLAEKNCDLIARSAQAIITSFLIDHITGVEFQDDPLILTERALISLVSEKPTVKTKGRVPKLATRPKSKIKKQLRWLKASPLLIRGPT